MRHTPVTSGGRAALNALGQSLTTQSHHITRAHTRQTHGRCDAMWARIDTSVYCINQNTAVVSGRKQKQSPPPPHTHTDSLLTRGRHSATTTRLPIESPTNQPASRSNDVTALVYPNSYRSICSAPPAHATFHTTDRPSERASED